MELSELDEWADDFEAFHSQFSSLLGRREVQEQAVKYLQGLVSPVERKNGWRLAEAVGDKRPDATQRLLYKTIRVLGRFRNDRLCRYTGPGRYRAWNQCRVSQGQGLFLPTLQSGRLMCL